MSILGSYQWRQYTGKRAVINHEGYLFRKAKSLLSKCLEPNEGKVKLNCRTSIQYP